MEKTMLIVSDLHLGAGETVEGEKNVLEDFHYDDKFNEFLDWKCSEYQYPLELLILGDAFDFPQVIPEIGLRCENHSLGTTQEESSTRLKQVINGHPVFFNALKTFLLKGNTIRFIRGNHDIDIIWPNVIELLRQEIGGGSNLICEQNYIYREKGLYCEHGNQYSVENTFSNPLRPIVADPQGKERLERCWGTYFIDTVYNDIEARFPIIDNVEDGQVIRGALMAIKSEKIEFTAKAISRMLKIAYKAGLPVTGWVGSFVLGPDSIELPQEEELPTGHIATAEDFLKYLRDPQISEILLSRYKNSSDFRREFDAEIDEIVGKQLDKEVRLLPPENVNLTMGLITGKSSYERAAEKILRNNPDVDIVVFGHTHTPIDGNYPSKPLADDLKGKYFNSGSWTFSVDFDDPRNSGYSFDDLCQGAGVRKESLDFIEVSFTKYGVKAALGRA